MIGFSKGCVVLNQFLYEFQHIKSSDDELKSFISKIESMYWLDGGHSGGKNTWITSRTVLECLKCLSKCFSNVGIIIVYLLFMFRHKYFRARHTISNRR